MQVIIVSYLPGMFGEFFANAICPNNTVKIDSNNRFWYPNYLEVIGFECKNYPKDRAWPIGNRELAMLNNYYKDKTICLPTHWYNELSMTNLPCRAYRLYASDEKTLRLSYTLWWLKSHLYNVDPWPARWQELDDMIANNHPYKNDLIELKHNYHNWKFLSYKNNILVDNKPNLKNYIKKYYEFHQQGNARLVDGYNRYSAEQILTDYPDYSLENWSLIKNKLNVNSLEDNFLEILYEYATLFCPN